MLRSDAIAQQTTPIELDCRNAASLVQHARRIYNVREVDALSTQFGMTAVSI
jgi:hypothetical protein